MGRRGAVVTLVGLLACACVPPESASSHLLDDVRHYAEGIRWQRYENAASHLPPADREAFLDRYQGLEDELRIDEYEILRAKLDGDTAVVQLELTWHLDSRGVVEKTVLEQAWERKGKAWLLVDEHVLRGEDLPYAPEGPVAADAPDASPG